MSYAVRLIGVIACGVTALVMLAWKLQWEGVTSLLPGLPPMTFNTALGLCLGSISLLCLSMPGQVGQKGPRLRRGSLVAAALAGLLALLTITQMVAGVSLGIDELFAIDTVARAKGSINVPGRMSPATAMAMLLLSLPLVMGSLRSSRDSLRWLVSACSMVAIAIGAMAGASSVIDGGAIRSVPFFSTMALHTSWLFVSLGAGTLMVQFARSTEGVTIGRRPTTRAGLWLTATVILVFAIGIAMTALVSKRTTSKEIETAQARFERLSDRVIVEADRRVYLPVYGLRGLRAFYAGSEHVSRLEFREFVESRVIAEEFPGTIGMGFIERVPSDEIEQFLERERADHAPEYRIKTVGEHDVLYPIKFIDPLEDNVPAWGYDVGSEANRRNAVETAIRTGEPTLTHRITLVQDELEQPGFLFLVPVYENNMPVETEEQRVAALTGLVYSAIVVSGIFDGVVDVAEGGIQYAVHEGTAVTDETKIYEDLGGGVFSLGSSPSRLNSGAKFRATHRVEAGSRTWTIETVSSPVFDASVHSSQSTMVMLNGLILSTLAACFVWLLGCARANAIALVESKTRDLQATTADLRKSSDLIAKQNTELNAMAERAHRVVDDVSHEFRTPLAVIKEFASIISDGLAGPVSEQQGQYLKIMSGAVVDLNHMVEDLLDSSKLRAGRLRVERRPYSVETIFENGRAALARKASSRSIVIEEHVEEGLSRVFADEEKVRRVISNLMTNAIKFSPEGSTIVLSATSSELPGEVRIGVTDRGPGLSEEDIDSLFGRFQQVSTARSVAAKGFGLGLSIAQELTWLNLGKISVESQKGKGATFSFTLPCDDPAIVLDHYFSAMAVSNRAADELVLLRVTAEDCDDPAEPASFLASITYPTDLVLPDTTNNPGQGAVGRSWWILGRTESAMSWVARIDRARWSQIKGDGLDLSPLRIDVRNTWWYPAEAEQAKQEVEQAMVGVASHV